MSETSIVGTSQIGFIPTDDNVLLEGKATNSCLGLKEKNYDKGKLFSYKIAGFGPHVTDLTVGDTVKIMTGSESLIAGLDNANSFDSMTKMLKGLSNKEYTELIEGLIKKNGTAELEFTEYFITKRYAILGIYTK